MWRNFGKMSVEFDPWDDPEIQSLIERFEGMLDYKGHYFFDSEDFEEIIDYYMERNNLRKAGQAISMAMNQYPLNISFIIRKAQLLLDQGKAEDALNILREAEFLDPANVDLIMSKAAIYSKMKLYEKAISEYNRALQETDDPDEIYSLIAFEYENLGNYELAVQYLEKALLANPELESALYEIGFCFEITHQLDRGIHFFSTFTDKHPYSKVAWFCKGVLNNARGTYEEAIDAYDFVIAIDESFSSAYFNKANAYANLGQFEKAIAQYQETFSFETPEAMTFYYIGECYEELEEYEKALENFNEAISLDEFLAEAYLSAGHCYHLLSKPHQAIKYMHKAIELDADNAYYWYQLAETLFDQNEFVRASEAMQKATDLEPENSEMWDYAAFIYAQKAEFVNAIDILNEGIARIPEDSLLHYHLASCLWMDGKIKESMRIFENALGLDFANHQAVFDYFPEMKSSTSILALIEQYRISQ